MPKKPSNKIAGFVAQTGLKGLNSKDKTLFLLKNFFSIKLVKIITIALIVILIAPMVLFIFLRPKEQKSINYGVTFSRKYSEQIGLDWKNTYIKMLDDLGVKNVRVVAYWDDAEKEKGKYDLSDVIWQLEEADKRNVNVIMSIGRKVPRYPECFEPTWWKNTPLEEDKNAALYEYIKNAVLILKDHTSIKMWQVENEPFFPFGTCTNITKSVVENEVSIVRDIDKRPILIQDSGEAGLWFPSYSLADYLGISMYRKIWYNFWGIFFGKFIYFQYPLGHWTYKIRADLLGVPYQKIIVTELQAEPWGPGLTTQLSQEERDKTMSRQKFIDTINYAQKAGFKDLYFWGVEWWLWEKEVNNNPFYWDTAKALFH